MKKFITILLFAPLACSSLFAQEVIQAKDTSASKNTLPFLAKPDATNKYNVAVLTPYYLHKLNKDTSDLAKKQLYFYKIDGSDRIYTAAASINLVDQGSISAMNFLKDKSATDQFGPKATNGVIIISLLQGTDILQADQLLDKYKIARKDRNLPLYIDSCLNRNSDKLFYPTKSIKSVTIAAEKETGMNYISILTNNDKINH
ncbi:hypothetical protein FO440_04395 [Mucilaginibacter corticis]|uniref:Uncharacterized protein n=1 Tax=Mucilaginibacter corticis TaxID=2597670 RepID=A0A556MU69_9SPHI|nr:hypothetical protein [Mucilaginibacter corticis]TSJ43437.1 hypothetical protein FO440_04395 [Mucilaginibacter corticis]